jgi:hypothetical protein
MELRYTGFDQVRNIRTYKFDHVAPGETVRHLLVIADLDLFLLHRVGIQEGPALCMRHLNTNADSGANLEHRLTTEDLTAFTAARTLAADKKRTAPKRPRPVQPEEGGWRRFPL